MTSSDPGGTGEDPRVDALGERLRRAWRQGLTANGDMPPTNAEARNLLARLDAARPNPAARFLASEACGLTNIAESAHRVGNSSEANWMLTLASAFARKAAEIDPTLGTALDVVVTGVGDGDSLSERALASPSPAGTGDERERLARQRRVIETQRKVLDGHFKMDRASLVASIERALFGTEDGGQLDDEDATVPIGEYRRLLREVWVESAGPLEREWFEAQGLELRALATPAETRDPVADLGISPAGLPYDEGPCRGGDI